MVIFQAALVAMVFVFGFAAQAHTHNHVEGETLCEGFIEPNDRKIPVYPAIMNQQAPGLSQAEFNEAMDRLERIYTKDVEALGMKLKVNRLWENSTVNASAQKMGSTQVLNMYGGLARHPAITFEGFSLVLCHEFGHHNGGAPKNFGFSSWASNEGGSDYFATMKCLRKIFAEDDNEAILAAKADKLDAFAVEACTKAWTEKVDQNLCIRSSLAGQSVANFFAEMKKEELPKFETPDKNEVSRTNNSHPATQCRLDTYFAGMICPVHENEKLSNNDYKPGSCYTPRDSEGFRPRCWFAPK